jgi:hypothetical protein
LSSEAVPADLLTVRAPTPDWFRWAIAHPGQSQFLTVAGCRIHYLVWPREPARPDVRGLLFVHGGGYMIIAGETDEAAMAKWDLYNQGADLDTLEQHDAISMRSASSRTCWLQR